MRQSPRLDAALGLGRGNTTLALARLQNRSPPPIPALKLLARGVDRGRRRLEHALRALAQALGWPALLRHGASGFAPEPNAELYHKK